MAASDVAPNGDCSLCGGTHYGSTSCPYQCSKCRVNVDPCIEEKCPKNARWAKEAIDLANRPKPVHVKPWKVCFNGVNAFVVDKNGKTVPWELVEGAMNAA